MGQAECLEFLEKNNNRWILTKEICDGLNQIPSVITRSLRRLYKAGEIMRRETHNRRGYEWKIITMKKLNTRF